MNRRRYRTREDARRAFYKYVCKEGYYGRMLKLPDDAKLVPPRYYEVDGKIYYRDWCQNYVLGYPQFTRQTSQVKSWWYDRGKARYEQAFHIQYQRDTQTDALLDAFRKARKQHLSLAYERYFTGVGWTNVPGNLLFLAQSLMRLKEVIKHKKRT